MSRRTDKEDGRKEREAEAAAAQAAAQAAAVEATPAKTSLWAKLGLGVVVVLGVGGYLVYKHFEVNWELKNRTGESHGSWVGSGVIVLVDVVSKDFVDHDGQTGQRKDITESRARVTSIDLATGVAKSSLFSDDDPTCVVADGHLGCRGVDGDNGITLDMRTLKKLGPLTAGTVAGAVPSCEIAHVAEVAGGHFATGPAMPGAAAQAIRPSLPSAEILVDTRTHAPIHDGHGPFIQYGRDPSHVALLDATGKPVWTLPIGNHCEVATVEGGVLVIGSDGKPRAQAIELETGKVRWSH